MKKIVILFILTLLLTACDANYSAEITEDGIKENVILSTNINSDHLEIYQDTYVKDLFESYLESYEPSYYNPENYDYYVGGYQPNIDYYKIKEYNNNSHYGVELNYNFDYGDYYRSSVIKKCFQEFTIQKNDEMYTLKTNNKCQAFEEYPLLENLNINIRIDYELVYHNADSVNNNTLTWNINKDNYFNKSIKIVYDTIEDDLSNFDPNNKDEVIDFDEKEENIEDNDDINLDGKYNGLIITLTVIIFIVVLVIILKIKTKRI